MNREEFESVKHLENNFKTAIESKYTRAVSKKDRNTLGVLFQKYSKEPVVVNINCSECIVTALQVVGKEYYKYKDNVDASADRDKEKSGDRVDSRRNSKARNHKTDS